MPHMWNNTQLRSDASEAVRRVARSIQRDVREMYSQVVQVLIVNHPDLFADPNRRRRSNLSLEDEEDDSDDDEEPDDDDLSTRSTLNENDDDIKGGMVSFRSKGSSGHSHW